MSFQLIYHARVAPMHKPEGQMTARSRTILAVLEQALIDLSSQLYPGSSTAPVTQFSYLQLECCSTTFHVLSCLQTTPLPADEQEFTAHHLALTHDEVQALRRNASRPTPAGVILALSNIGLWCTSGAENRFGYIDDEPRLTAAALPEAELQPTWKSLTGHKNNARAFFTPPYDRNCLVTIPADMSSREVLLLLHESDWLSASRGWGRTFTTQAGPYSAQLNYHRTILPPGSKVPTNDKRPLLAISAELELSYNDSDTPVTSATAPGTPHRPQMTGINSSIGTNYLPYKYTETPDEDIYDIMPQPNKLVRWSCYLGGAALLWLSISLISGLMMDDAVEITGNIITRINTEEDALLLSRLASSAYSHESTERHLSKFEARLRNLPANDESQSRSQLLDCVQLLRQASLSAQGHPTRLRQLRKCAVTLKLREEDICKLYMNEAIYNCTPEDWQQSLTDTEIADWKLLLNDFPTMAEWLSEPPFVTYIQPIGITPPAPQPEQTTLNAPKS